METPFFDRIAQLAETKIRFFVPGHKGNADAFAPLGPFLSPAMRQDLGRILRYDLTEIPGADDLSRPGGPLLASEENMGRVFGSGATLYSASGTSSCILAMLSLFLAPGQRVLMMRGCHAAAVRALCLIGARPVWLLPDEGQLSPKVLEEALQRDPGVPVYITSPDYYGRTCDVGALAGLCRAYGSPLLVDNAQGAHLRFFFDPEGGQDLHPLSLGADAVCDSAHKTLPCLTPAALLHLRNPALKDAARSALNLYCSTSPSYLVLASLDLAAGILPECHSNFSRAAKKFAAIAKNHAHFILPCDDPLRLILAPARGGWAAETICSALARGGILPEYNDGQRMVFMASPWNREEDFEGLDRALAAFPSRGVLPLEALPAPCLPERVMEPREALWGEKIRCPSGQAAGRVVAEITAPCPPGVPLVLPGERLDRESAGLLEQSGIPALDVIK